jgi:hypothetical protein
VGDGWDEGELVIGGHDGFQAYGLLGVLRAGTGDFYSGRSGSSAPILGRLAFTLVLSASGKRAK